MQGSSIHGRGHLPSGRPRRRDVAASARQRMTRKIQADRWVRWWTCYQAITDYSLQITAETAVDTFSIDSELLTTERQTGRWRVFIQRATERYRGRLIYSTNWNHDGVPAFWGQIDMIGIHGYWDLTEGAATDRPSLGHLTKRWKRIRKLVLSFARGRPVLFTGIGYPSLPMGTQR